ncbi:MAG: 3D domain-containing protein [Planctomycetota bacterium]
MPIASPLRGTRRTQPFAYALVAVVVLGTTMIAATVTWGVVAGWGGGDSLELMKLDAGNPAAGAADLENIAPSRPAPGVRAAAPPRLDPVLIEREQQLRSQTQDRGPSLGQTLPNPAVSSDAPPTFDGRPIRPVKTLRMLTTAYSPDARSCGKWADGITASGYSVWTNGMKLAAADTKLLPFGTIITVPGYNGGRPVPVLDRGGVIKGARLDLLYPTHERALQWGAQRLDVTVWEYADDE